MAAAGEGGLEEIVFIVEVPRAEGLPKPEQTIAKLGGFAFGGHVTSVAAPEPSAEPSGWLFPTKASLSAAPAVAEAAKAKKGAPAEAAPAVTESEPEPAYRLSCPCSTPNDRQKLLDSVCSPLEVVLTRSTEPFMTLGTATLSMEDLIHSSDVVEAEVELRWSEELLAELNTEFEEQLAAQKAETGETEGAEGEEGAEGATPEAAPPFEAPVPGRIRVRVSTAGPIGRVLCPEDLNDWAVLSVQIHGCYGLPEALRALADAPEPAAPAGKGAPAAPAPVDVGYSLRLLGCDFDGGQLVKPVTEAAEGSEEPPPAAEVAGGEAAAADGAEEGAEDADQTRAPSPPAFYCEVGQEEFIEGMLRAGFARAPVDGPAIFDYLGRPRTGLGGKIGPQDFARLEEISVPAEPAQLVVLFDRLVEKHASLDEAFGALDEAGNGSVGKDAFTAGLEALGYTENPSEVEALFSALDAQQEEAISREDFSMLGLYKRMADMSGIEKAKNWLLTCTGSVQNLVMQVDETKSGAVTLESWKAAVEKLGYPNAVEAEMVFVFLDTAKEESIPTTALDTLQRLDVAALREALPAVEELLLPSGVAEEAIVRLLGDAAGGESVSQSAFVEGCAKLGGLTPDAALVFGLLDVQSAGSIVASDVEALQRYNYVSRRRCLAACRTFIEGTFGSVTDAFKKMFDDRTDFYSEAEETMARIEWSKNIVSAYRGREWLQQLLNTLHDERGRKCASEDSSANGGCWLYFFPKLGSQEEVGDFKDMTEGNDKTVARTCRWHHAQGFVDLRRLTAPLAAGTRGPEVEFRAFLSQMVELPEDLNAAGDLSPAAFGASQTYVKGVIRLDRPLLRLCPRDIQPLPEPGGQPFIPPAPAKKPPPTVIEELEYDARRIVGKLAVHFARMCKEEGLEEPQVHGPNGEEGPHVLLGRRDVSPDQFFGWLMEQEEGQVYKELSADLRPAIVKMVRSEAKDGPSCGLNGNEDDARYSAIRDMILKHLFRALNQDITLYKRKRDARLWRSPLLKNDADAQDPSFGKPADLAAQQRKQDMALRRLIFEYELIGDHERAAELFKERLALPSNSESGDSWFGFARFLMRCGQRQPQALEALRYATSLRSAESGPSQQEAVFLACMLLNYELPCTGGNQEPPQDLRFDAAVSILSGYADKHPGEPEPLYFLFAAYAREAANAASVEAAHRAMGMGSQATDQAADRLKAEAAKYLRLARAAPGVFAGTLGKPDFPDLQALLRREGLARGLGHEAAATSLETPVAYAAPKQPYFASFEEVHQLTDADDATALGCIDLMLYLGVPVLVPFLLEATEEYEFVSKKTAESDRCRLQLIKGAMLAEQWDQATSLIEALLARCSRIREAHVLRGECLYRKARQVAGTSAPEAYAPALDAFKAALAFLAEPEGEAKLPEVKSPKEDPVLHLRVASIFYGSAAASGFTDAEAMAKAEEHYTKALRVAPTAEAWKNAGMCAYRRARLEKTLECRKAHLKRAVQCLGQSNLLDNGRPQVNAWLAICSAGLGRGQVAKQAIRQVLRFQERLDVPTALELAEVLLHFSDEKKAAPGERPQLVQEARYAMEAIAISQVVLKKLGNGAERTLDAGRARYVLAQAQALIGENAAAVVEFCKTLPCFIDDAARGHEAENDARSCAATLLGEPRFAAAVEDAASQAAAARQERLAALAAMQEAAAEEEAPAVDANMEADEAVLEGGEPDEPNPQEDE